MKKIMTLTLFVSLAFLISCAETEDIEPAKPKLQSNEGYSENGNSGGGSGDTPPPPGGG